MGRTVLGSLAAGFVMFILGWVFFGSPLYTMLSGAAAGEQPSVQTLVMGFVLFAIVSWALATLLSFVPAGARMQATIWAAATAMLFTNVGAPIWDGADWRMSIYAAVAGFVMLVAAGFVLIRWFAPASAMAAAE